MKKWNLSDIFLLFYIIFYLLHIKIEMSNYILITIFLIYILFSLNNIKLTRNNCLLIVIFLLSYFIPSLLNENIIYGIKNLIQIIITISPMIIYFIEVNKCNRKKEEIVYSNLKKGKFLIYFLIIYIFIINLIYLNDNPYFARTMANYNYDIPGISGIALFSGGGYFIVYGLIFLSLIFLNNIFNKKKPMYKVFNIVLYLGTALVIFKANFATAFIIFGIGAVIYVFIKNQKKMKLINYLFLILLVPCIINYDIIFNNIKNFFPDDSIIYIRINDAINNTEKSTYNERLDLTMQSVEAIKENPLIGKAHKYKYDYNLMKNELGLHTEWIDIFAKYGVIVVIIYIYIIFNAFKSLITKSKNSNNYVVYITCIITLLILGFFNPISNTACFGIIFQVIPILMEDKNEKNI